MKKVILEQRDTLVLSELNPSHIIGVELSDSSKGFVTKVRAMEWILASSSDAANNYSEKIIGCTIQDLLSQLCSVVISVNVFDNTKELFEWLAQEDDDLPW